MSTTCTCTNVHVIDCIAKRKSSEAKVTCTCTYTLYHTLVNLVLYTFVYTCTCTCTYPKFSVTEKLLVLLKTTSHIHRKQNIEAVFFLKTDVLMAGNPGFSPEIFLKRAVHLLRYVTS